MPRDSQRGRALAVKLPGLDLLPTDPHLRARASSAWYTPADVARRLADFCYGAQLQTAKPSPWRVLEPAAGHGVLIDALIQQRSPHERTVIDAIEIDPQSAGVLADKATAWPCRVRVHVGDYLERPAPKRPYDLCLMNPPYDDGLDSAFLEKAMSESLRVVALVRLALLESRRSYERIWSKCETKSDHPQHWNLVHLCPMIARPSFLLGGKDTGYGKTAFMMIGMTRLNDGPTCVHWI